MPPPPPTPRCGRVVHDDSTYLCIVLLLQLQNCIWTALPYAHETRAKSAFIFLPELRVHDKQPSSPFIAQACALQRAALPVHTGWVLLLQRKAEEQFAASRAAPQGPFWLPRWNRESLAAGAAAAAQRRFCQRSRCFLSAQLLPPEKGGLLWLPAVRVKNQNGDGLGARARDRAYGARQLFWAAQAAAQSRRITRVQDALLPTVRCRAGPARHAHGGERRGPQEVGKATTTTSRWP